MKKKHRLPPVAKKLKHRVPLETVITMVEYCEAKKDTKLKQQKNK